LEEAKRVFFPGEQTELMELKPQKKISTKILIENSTLALMLP
jgi:hypothetical protein